MPSLYLYPMNNKDLHDALIREVEYRIYDECLPRILKCIDMLEEEKIWWRPNPNSNSIGNLVLHLTGNVRQWIYAGLGRNKDIRNRNWEFEEATKMSKDELKTELVAVLNLIRPVISQLPAEELLIIRRVQTFEESGLTILIHVTEHFSYHTGQIAYITKMITNQPLGFYEGVNLQ